MCGIIGQIKQGETINSQLFNAMRDSMLHRGPDGYGTVFFNNDCAAFGHRRLSIIDLSEKAKQPMYDVDNNILLTFNGEIYNYKHIKNDLIALGYKFNSTSDTEVLLNAYKAWGLEKLLERIKGMFAFAIWDNTKQKLFLARDRFGIKPLYFYKDAKQICFASELKALAIDSSIEKKVNKNAIADYFIYSYIPSPNCIWENFYKLEPATYMIFDYRKNTISKKEYWKLSIDNKKANSHEVQEKTNQLIKNAVSQHLVSDVSVGLFLSGGYDSSTLLIHSKELNYKPNTFSLGFKDSKRSEHEIAALIAKKMETAHAELILNKKTNYLLALKNLGHFYDEPFAVSSMLPYYYISELTSKTNKVALAGDGGDEVFAGYKWHADIKKYFALKSFKGKLKTLFKGKKNELIEMYNKRMTSSYKKDSFSFLNSAILKAIEKRNFWFYKKHYIHDKDVLKTTQYLDFKTFIPEVNLTRADRSSMANSLEVRVPFLDHELYEYIFSLDSTLYFKENRKKVLLENKLNKYLPKEVLEMPKYGFSFQFLNSIFDKSFEEMIMNGNLMKEGIINKNSDFSNTNHVTKFHLLMLELWFENYNTITKSDA